ncbi:MULTISPECIES: PHB depolymerase family esterase [Rhodopseudomonas]|uniref:Esterase n=1 Tax=Rhodopseudomonas palustris TaxID=1076 RepID=A0A0D7EYB7_RHOPL|nr:MULTISPECIES: PHB depolymerase family esterase [Rhodopseudomonas]KIZ45570.1 esterase [Rhodopseudomonas palustris]MDF3814022.1 PHB depolymerase family esterase [Rhodopseudomonas sp. BAL398]WOK16841.1 PHB depolymerase family esterase [Rhodopseudomonas sp. BAL398]
MSLSRNIDFLNRLRKMNGISALDPSLWGGKPSGAGSRLVETAEFGPNPGDLRMFTFAPEGVTGKMPLVVVLHGCGQNAAGYEIGAGWSTLARRFGFALLMPEQKSANNSNGCFNWFVPEDTTRGSGEAASIRQMIDHVAGTHQIDRDQIFVTGLSAGGAMTAVMLATYPEVFAGGAIIAGLPFGIASNVQQALSGMMRSPAHSARELGDLVRNASAHKGPWPRLSVWHGSADRTVNPSNADEIVKQWLDLHQLPAAPMSEGIVDGYPRQVWWNADGETVIESYSITSMPHGTPLGLAANDERYGVEGAFLLEVGISSSYHIASFFGLTERIPQTIIPQTKAVAMPDLVAPKPERVEEIAQAYKVRAKGDRRADQRDPPGRRALDINGVITRALTAAGLMK